MAREVRARPLTVAEAKACLLDDDRAAAAPGVVNDLVRQHPTAALLIAATAGVVLLRSAALRSLLVPAAIALVRQALR
jgi:hypothetical protein